MSKPYLPYFCVGPIIKGFGRGSTDLGIPTGIVYWLIFPNNAMKNLNSIKCFLANFGLDIVKKLPAEFATGIYFGWANIDNGDVYKAVLSIGWNPFYVNKEKSLVRDNKIRYK